MAKKNDPLLSAGLFQPAEDRSKIYGQHITLEMAEKLLNQTKQLIQQQDASYKI